MVNSGNITINVVSSPKQCVRRLLFTASQIKKMFYQKNDYILITDKQEFPYEDMVYIPVNIYKYLTQNFDWNSLDSDYWYDNYQTASIPAEFEELLDLFPPEKTKIFPYDYDRFIDAALFICELFEVKQLNINLSQMNFGTIGSYDTSDYPPVVHLYMRDDTSLVDLIKCLIMPIIKHVYSDRTWAEYQSLQDFFVYKTKLRSIIQPKQVYRIRSIRDYSGEYQKLYNTSKHNYIILGYPVTDSIVVKNGAIYFDEEKIDFLSSTEEKAFKYLLSKKGKVCSMEEIGDCLWADDIDKYSLYAISKVIERIRKKLKSIDLNKEYIFTKRGVGYVFIS